MRTYRLLLGALVGAGLCVGCGLVSDDTANVDLSALQKTFTIDAAAWNLNPAATSSLLSRACDPDAMPDPCSSQVIASNVCKLAVCDASCNPDTSRCQLALRTELWRTINLATDLPGLVAAQNPQDDALEIMLDDVSYEVTQNTFNLDLEGLTVFVAPASVTSPLEASPLGTIHSIAAGEGSPRRGLDFVSGGKDTLRRRLSDYQVPFNLILGSTLTFEGDAILPAGRIETVLGFDGRAGGT